MQQSNNVDGAHLNYILWAHCICLVNIKTPEDQL